MSLYLLRHPQPEIAPGVCYGRFDIDLKAGALTSTLRALEATLPRGLPCLTSPSQRCRKLADALHARGWVSSLAYEPRLFEMHFGDWEGRNWDDIGEAEVGAWANNLLDGRAPNGESAREVISRVNALRADLVGPNDILLVTHAGVIRTFLHLASGKPPEDWRWDQPPLAYGSLHRLD